MHTCYFRICWIRSNLDKYGWVTEITIDVNLELVGLWNWRKQMEKKYYQKKKIRKEKGLSFYSKSMRTRKQHFTHASRLAVNYLCHSFIFFVVGLFRCSCVGCISYYIRHKCRWHHFHFRKCHFCYIQSVAVGF